MTARTHMHFIAALASSACAACSSSSACPDTLAPPIPAAFVVTVQDAATQQPITTGVTFTVDGGPWDSMCFNGPGPLADGGPVSCPNGWAFDFFDSEHTRAVPSVEQHSIAVTAPGYATSVLSAVASFECGSATGGPGPTRLVASLNRQ